MFWRLFALAVFLIGSMSCASSFAEEGWSWNPFSKSKSSAPKSPETKSSWVPSMPTMKNPFSTKSSTEKKKPSMATKMTKSTKNAWNKTVEFLDPYPDEKPVSSSSSKSAEKTDSWIPNWFSRKQEKKYDDANDWLRQPRP